MIIYQLINQNDGSNYTFSESSAYSSPEHLTNSHREIARGIYLLENV